ncbi:unnamed protein product [Linum tenue]|uniref:non-specific serine/threonine protein kinase n=1 Tax=Linum tenue TaxID=586396 RepID=A0AAV0I9E3_9ROSI|nr:unnamed protein product [Linum tenue]
MSPSGTNLFSLPLLLFLQFCFTFFQITNVAASSRIVLGNETDRMALLEFKSMIYSDPLGSLRSWNPLLVRILDLRSLELAGSISPHIGNLSFLWELTLINNSFSQGIPPEIGHMRRLKRLFLGNNSLTGEIPSNISASSALTIFHVGNNKLVGRLPLPSTLWNAKLQGFWVYRNMLTGTIPPSFGNLSSLEILSLGQNRLSGAVPDTLGRFERLGVLDLALNNMSGEIPSPIFNLSSLTYLAFGHNQIRGGLPHDLGTSLLNLQNLDVDSNELTGSVPDSLSNATNLITLQLQGNHFRGRMPCMASSLNLRLFLINQNSLGSNGEYSDDLKFVSCLTNATGLEVLFIGDNDFGGEFPDSITNLSTSLKFLNLTATKISGSIPDGIHNLVNLQMFEASHTRLSGTISSNIGDLKSLESLDLSHNNISGSIPSGFGNLTRLVFLSLAANQIQGGIPATIGNCQNLIGLDLSDNNLSGVIPQQVMGITSLARFLNLSHDRFSGAVSAEVGNLKNLGTLDLSHNILSGSIPNSLGSCVRLELVNLQENLFQGPIPSSLSSLKGIEHFDVSVNNLSGRIPKFFEDMKYMEVLNMSYNDFEGEVPQGGVLKNGSIISIMGNSKLCGGTNSTTFHFSLPPCHFMPPKKKLSHKWKVVVLVLLILLSITFMGSCLIVFWIKKRGNPDTVSDGDSGMQQLSYQNLFKATDGFSETSLIGLGSFGSVYKGVLDNGGMVAVKVFNLQRRGAGKSFVAECEALKSIRHRNLVRIVTVCSGIDHRGNDFKALVYEFMENGSLEDWLHPVENNSDETSRSLNFRQRLNIAVDIVYALDYLHHQCETPIVHCDLKPSNILLDEEKTGRVGDFGLARFLLSSFNNPSATSSISSSIGIKGTVGYAPPEYGMGNEVSTQGDVYSYGILLLELFTGRRPTDEIFRDGLSLQNFVQNGLSQQHQLLHEVLDPILLNELLIGRVSEKVATSILDIGVACSSDSPQERPSISQVLARLKKPLA